MVDVVDKATRSRMMAGIRAKNTLPELQIRSLLHRNGFRYGLHRNDLPGKPDLALPKYRVVIFVHGCFWHGHQCAIFKWPSTNARFWRSKIEGNIARDHKSLTLLKQQGWKPIVLWECAIRHAARRHSLEKFIARLAGKIKAQKCLE